MLVYTLLAFLSSHSLFSLLEITCCRVQKMEQFDCGVYKLLLAWLATRVTTTLCGTPSFLRTDIILSPADTTGWLGKKWTPVNPQLPV